MSEITATRRELLKKAGAIAGLIVGGRALLGPFEAFAETAAPGKKVFKLIDPVKNVTAKSLKYAHVASEVQEKRRLPTANCGNCQMYRAKGEVDGVEVGSCNMLGGGYVKVTGWCTSWTRDPKKLKS